jgi:murein DD-endopeptidase MepM/ murein hydrolase activator NlpD
MTTTDKKIKILSRAIAKVRAGILDQHLLKLSSQNDVNELFLQVSGLSDLSPEELSVEIKSLNKALIELGYEEIRDDSSWEAKNNIALKDALQKSGESLGVKSYTQVKKILSDSLSKSSYSTETGLNGKVINISPGRVLFFRAGPSPKSQKIGELLPYQNFIYLGDSQEYQGYNYIKISANNKVGWIISNYAEYYDRDGSTLFSGKPPEKRVFEPSRKDLGREERKPLPESSGFIMPISGAEVRSEYGMRDDPMNRGHQRMHSGVDLSARTGTPVLAPESGVITRIAPDNGRAGNMMVLSGSDGRAWTFMHLSSFNAKKDETVSQGQVIAYSGATGGVTGPHLHLELSINGSKVNPMTVLPGASMEQASEQKISSRQNSDEKQDWLKSVSDISTAISSKYGIPKSIILSQGSLESGYGKSDLGAFNFFGMKGSGSAGSVSADTSEEYHPGFTTQENANFQAFKSVEDSFDSYGRMMKNNQRYSLATERYSNQPGKFIIYIWGKGYATDSEYPRKISQTSKVVSTKLSEPNLAFSFSPEEEAIISELASLSGDARSKRTDEILGYSPRYS